VVCMASRTSSGFVEAPSLMRNSGSSSVGRWGARRAGGRRDAAAAMKRSAAARCVCQWNDLHIAAGTAFAWLCCRGSLRGCISDAWTWQ
jgi:hypothetical protein